MGPPNDARTHARGLLAENGSEYILPIMLKGKSQATKTYWGSGVILPLMLNFQHQMKLTQCQIAGSGLDIVSSTRRA